MDLIMAYGICMYMEISDVNGMIRQKWNILK